MNDLNSCGAPTDHLTDFMRERSRQKTCSGCEERNVVENASRICRAVHRYAEVLVWNDSHNADTLSSTLAIEERQAA